MGTKSININSRQLITDPKSLYDIPSNKVFWYDNNQLEWYRQYIRYKLWGVDISYYKNGSLECNILHKKKCRI